MAGILDEIFHARTNGNGYVEQEWNHTLLKREIAWLLAEARIQEVPSPPRRGSEYPTEWETKRYLDLETGDIYEYLGPWDRGGPRFHKAVSE